jgi:hypothetical protein
VIRLLGQKWADCSSFWRIFEKKGEENIFCQEEEAMPRRVGQGPGRLPGKINELKWVQLATTCYNLDPLGRPKSMHTDAHFIYFCNFVRKYFIVKRRRPRPRREGQGPGGLPGKINEAT